MADKEYTILLVQERKPWTGSFGTFNSYALQLSGFDGWVELSQKPETPAPQINTKVFGHIESTVRGENTYFKFKKAKSGEFAKSVGISKEDGEYIIMMLEELTLRRESPEVPTRRAVTELISDKPKDVIVQDLDDKPIDLSEIPF